MGQRDWDREISSELGRERWTLTGANRIVKVVPLVSLPIGTQAALGPAGHLSGYITLAVYLRGKTPQQIESDLGLQRQFLANGALIYNFARLPMRHEYEYELTADRPGGSAPSFMSSPDYPAGSRKIHQWAIKENVQIPVQGAPQRLQPGQRFPG